MNTSIAECVKFTNENPRCFLATVEGDQPRVRGMHLMFSNEQGFYFTTGNFKGMYGQLQKNPKTEVCFFSPKEMRSMRIAGEVEFITDMKEKEEIFKKTQWLKNIIGTHDNAMWTPFRIQRGVAYFWTMAANLEKPNYIGFDFK
ncbi:pyridoxamine 5'-phosphate oxidase [bacterium]|nr:MAG: pyridoxamine 5'-phosphate oxidase [bacterium]